MDLLRIYNVIEYFSNIMARRKKPDYVCSKCGNGVMAEEVFHLKKYPNLCIPCYHNKSTWDEM